MVRAAIARGVDPADILARHGVAKSMLVEPDNHLPATVELAIWHDLQIATGMPALPLIAAAEMPVGTYHVLEYLIGASATVGDGLLRCARFIGIVARQVRLTASIGEDECRITATTTDGGVVPPPYVDYTFGAIVGRVRTNYRPSLRVAGVELRQRSPVDASPYAGVFRAPVCFDAALDCLRFNRDEWDTPFDTADPTLAEVLEVHARIRLARMATPSAELGTDLRRAIIGALPNGAQVNDVARRLHVSVRTLQRRLTGTGTTYREALESVRSELARQYLQDHNVAIAEVALLLGFADQSSFHRAFERWTGLPPGRWRAAAPPSPGSSENLP